MILKEVQEKVRLAYKALEPRHPDAATVDKPVKDKTAIEYVVTANRLIGVSSQDIQAFNPTSADLLFDEVRQRTTKSTLRKYARAIRFTAMQRLSKILETQAAYLGAHNLKAADQLMSASITDQLIRLAQLMPEDYLKNWSPKRKRKSKKTSFKGLPEDWREQVVKAAIPKRRLAVLILALTGSRPAEIHKGIIVRRNENGIITLVIEGAKVTERSGQKKRGLVLKPSTLESMLQDELNQMGENEMEISIPNPNSLTTYLRCLCARIFPDHKRPITAYSFRHAMASDCKATGISLLASKVLGHRVDKTSSYYGSKQQGGANGLAPTGAAVTKDIKNKSTSRLMTRDIRIKKAKSHQSLENM
jgi:integrase